MTTTPMPASEPTSPDAPTTQLPAADDESQATRADDPLSARLAELEARTAHLERRLATALPATSSPATPEAPDRPAAPGMKVPVVGAAAQPEEVFWALLGLRDRLGQQPETEDGALLLTAAAWLPTGDYVERQLCVGATELFETDWATLAPALAALGHPVRLGLLKLVLSGTRATAELQAAGLLGSSGQLHHHMRQLLAAGWLTQTQRGVYEVAGERLVPLLFVLAATGA